MIDTNVHSVSQDFDERPRADERRKGTREFDALSFELEREQLYQKAQSSYVEYEIDSVEEEFGEIFRVWDKRTLIGTFYETSQGWKAEAFYLCRRYIKAELDFSQDVEDSKLAIAYIESMYEGRSQSLTSEKSHLIAA